ncbi:MAG: osmotically inducible protein C [Spirochaetales bacterium]|nr:MAG: osmotically inducible protein C [Spirochaetales bacterium]
MGKIVTKAVWKGGRAFDAEMGNHIIRIDAPEASGGKDSGPKPPLLLLGGLLSCTGMDVVVMMEAYKVPFSSLHLECRAHQADKDPRVFTEAEVLYFVEGEGIEEKADKIVRAIEQSKQKFCCVSIMLSRSFPISARLFINGTEKEIIHE